MSSRALKLAAYTADRFVYYANRVPVIFSATYADTPENVAAKRVGKSHGFRQGVRSLAFVPSEYHPANPTREPGPNGPVRYFWLTRNRWRAFRAGNLTSISAWWSPAEGRFVDTPELAGVDAFPEFAALPAITAPRADTVARRNEAADRRRRFTQEQRQRADSARNQTRINRLTRAVR